MTQYEKPREQPLLAYISSGKITAVSDWKLKHCYRVDLCNPLVRVPLLTMYLFLKEAYLGEVAWLSYGSGQE